MRDTAPMLLVVTSTVTIVPNATLYVALGTTVVGTTPPLFYVSKAHFKKALTIDTYQ